MHRGYNSLRNAIYFMISTFTSLSWSHMASFLAHTKAHSPVVNVTASHLGVHQSHDLAIVPWYRPTRIQTLIPHPVVIDWVPFASLRDLLILHHSSNPRLDEVICDIVDAYSCEGDLSRLVMGASPHLASLRILDIVSAMSNSDVRTDSYEEQVGSLEQFLRDFQNENLTSTTFMTEPSGIRREIPMMDMETLRPSLPARTAAAIFRSKDLASQTFHLLGMDRGPGILKLDPVFFEQHPELYNDKTSLLISRGCSIRPSHGARSRPTRAPQPITSETLTRYTEMAKWAFDFDVSRQDNCSSLEGGSASVSLI